MRIQSGKARNLVATAIGNMLEFYDFTVYAAFSTFLSAACFPAGNPRLALLLSTVIFGIGFLARPLGAIVMGAYADHHGRRRALTLTIWLMALGSLMIGLLPGYATIGLAAPIMLSVARLIQGFSAGGEMGSATAFLVEAAARERIGLAASWQIATQHLGTIISGLCGILLGLSMSSTQIAGWGWRLPFILGAIIVPVGAWIRRNLDETLAPDQVRQGMVKNVRHVFMRMPGRIALCMLLVAGATISQYFFLYGTIFAIHDLRFPAAFAISVNIALGLTGCPFALLGGYLSDRYDPYIVTLAARAMLCGLFLPAFVFLLSHPSPLVFTLVLMLLMSLHALASGACMRILPDLFPMNVRTLGTGLSYSLGVTIFGGTAQTIFTLLIDRTGNRLSWIYFVTGMLVVSSSSLVFLRRIARHDRQRNRAGDAAGA